MKIKELTKTELEEVTKMYTEERDNLYGLWSLEEFCEQLVRKCECCGELVVVEECDDELPIGTTWRNEKLRCCDECLACIEDDNNDIVVEDEDE